MPTAEEFLLEHSNKPYDPVKAHEYYMRTRKLHPRTKSEQFLVNRGGGKTVKLSAQQLAEQKAYADHRVSVITNRLKDLKGKLQKKLAEENKKPTAADKHEAARESKKYRDKHKQELATKAKQESSKNTSSNSSSSSSTTQKSKAPQTADSLAEKVVETKASLKAAVEKQRQLATSKRIG